MRARGWTGIADRRVTGFAGALLALVLLVGPAVARAGGVPVTEARVWLENDSETMKRMGTQPRVSVQVTAGKVGPEACDAIATATKWGRVLWGMKGKAHAFEMRAPVSIDGEKKTIYGKLAVDAAGATTVTTCEVVEYDPGKDDAPVWPADPY